MEKQMMGWSVLITFVLVICVFSACPSDAVTCSEAATSLSPCKPFLVGSDLQPGSPCCVSVQNVLKEAGFSTAARRALCECYKTATAEIGVKTEKAQQFTQYCKFNNPLPISPNADCSTVS